MKQRFVFVFMGLMLFLFSCSSDPVKIKVIDDSFDFGVVYVNFSDSYDFTLENKTSKPIELLEVRIDGSQEFFIVSGGTGSIIEPKAQHAIKVMFEPVDKGLEQAVLSISHDASSKLIEIELTGTGETKPEFTVNPTQHDFGKVSRTLSVNQDFVVTNDGTAVLTLTSVTISGTDALEFLITAGDSVPIDIDPGLSHTITVEWNSNDPVANKNVSLDIIHNAESSPDSVSITGETIAFPPLVIQTTSMPNATNWTDYNELIQTTGGAGTPVLFTKLSGDLPDGMTLDPSTGAIYGKAHYCGKYDFEIEADDNVLPAVSKTISLEVTSKDAWESAAPSGFSLSGDGAMILSHDHKLYFMGGGSTAIKYLDVTLDTWNTAPVSLSSAHRLGNAVFYDKYIYIICGSGSTTVERYDIAANTISIDTSAPKVMYDFGIGVYNNEIYCISGANGGYYDAFKFTPGSGGSNGTWTQLPNTSTPTFGSGITTYNSSIVMFGGFYSSTELNTVRTYNPSNGAEANLGYLASGAGRFQWGRIGDILYIGSGSTTQFQSYDLSTNTGKMLASCPISKASYAAQMTECDGRIFVTNFSSALYAYIP